MRCHRPTVKRPTTTPGGPLNDPNRGILGDNFMAPMPLWQMANILELNCIEISHFQVIPENQRTSGKTCTISEIASKNGIF